MTKLCPFNVLVPKWHMTYFVPIDGHIGQIVRYGLKFVLPSIYINSDIQISFEVNQTQISHSIPKNTPKNHQNGLGFWAQFFVQSERPDVYFVCTSPFPKNIFVYTF